MSWTRSLPEDEGATAEGKKLPMKVVESVQFAQAIDEAEKIAEQSGQRETTAHLLLALTSLEEDGRAHRFFKEKGISSDRLLLSLQDGLPTERPTVLQRVLSDARNEAEKFANGSAATLEALDGSSSETCAVADSLHLFVALARAADGAAYELLKRSGLKDPLGLVATVEAIYREGGVPKWLKVAEPRSLPVFDSCEVSASVTVGKSSRPAKKASQPACRPLSAAPTRSMVPRSALSFRTVVPSEFSPVQMDVSSLDSGAFDLPIPFSPHPMPHQPGRVEVSISSIEPSEIPSDPISSPLDDDSSDSSLEPFILSPKTYPTLCQLGRNLSLMAAKGELDPVIGRQLEIDQVLDVLGKRRSNNPCLVGEPGVGKTAVVEGVAQALVELEQRGVDAGNRIIVEIDMGGLLSGTQLRGAFSERMRALQSEVRNANGRVIIFIDEIHTLLGAGASDDSPQDAANELKSALAKGEFPCIGATTHDEFRKHFLSDPALERRFTQIQVEEPGVEDSVAILKGVVGKYEAYHGVTYDSDALEAAACLAEKFIPNRRLPDKALSVMDLAASRARREGRHRIQAIDVARTVSRICGVPEERLIPGESKRLLKLQDDLAKKVIGHGDVIRTISEVLRRNYAGFSSHRPMGSFLFLGPTGVGKTELSKALASVLFGKKTALTRIDMSECSDPTGVSRLIGTAPGYVGFGEGGSLTEALRRTPSTVVLFDEVEKAHRDVLMLLLQILEEGEVSDSRGRKVSFTNSVVILTSNLGAESFSSKNKSMGFGSSSKSDGEKIKDQENRALEMAKNALAPELWNRLDATLCFHPLPKDDVAKIAALLLDDSSRRLIKTKGIEFAVTTQVIDFLLNNGGYDEALGARPMRRTVQRLIEAPLADAILEGRFQFGDMVAADVKQGAIEFRKIRKPGKIV